MVFRTMGPIEPVVSAHHCPGLRPFYNGFECRQVDFVQSPLVHFGANAKTLGFLIVSDKMLEGGTHAFPLHAIDQTNSHLPGKVRILR